MELKQNRFWDKRHFKLLEDGIWLRIKTPTEDAETKVKYEDLGLETVFVRKKAASFVFGGLIFLSTIVGRILLKTLTLDNTSDIVIFIVFFLFLFSILFLAWADSRKPLLGITGGEKSVTMIRNSPSELVVDNFVTNLQERIRDKIINLRVRPNDDELDFEYKERMLDSLREQSIIDENKYNEVLRKIERKRGRIGFMGKNINSD